MFTSKEGLQLYKDTVAVYLKKYKEIEKAEKQCRHADGKDYRGSTDWTPQDREWMKTTQHIMQGMETALGLSKEEIAMIWSYFQNRINILLE